MVVRVREMTTFNGVTKGNFRVIITFCYLWQKTAILGVTKGNTPL